MGRGAVEGRCEDVVGLAGGRVRRMLMVPSG